jgi:membrane-bound lytic murein transglycosylase D
MNYRYKRLQKILLSLVAVGIISFTSIILFCCFSGKGEKDEEYKKAFEQKYAIFAVNIPESLYFSGERVPLENFDVKESLDREMLVNTYWQSQTVLFIKKSKRFFAMIDPILKKNGIPADFRYVAFAESGMLNDISPAGAAGYWQFLKKTATDLGLEINEEVDERYNLEKSTEAACYYFQKSYESYKNWTIVAASYNVGRGGIDRQIAKQKTQNYYDLGLNNETSRYVYRILALKLILENPDNYGFHLREKDIYPIIPVYEIRVDSSIQNIAEFATIHHTNYKMIKYFNPWLRSNSLTNKLKKTYIIKIPKENVRTSVYLSEKTEQTDNTK